jgi:hypothetical protein
MRIQNALSFLYTDRRQCTISLNLRASGYGNLQRPIHKIVPRIHETVGSPRLLFVLEVITY